MQKQEGFTLMELMIVIVVIGVLSAIATVGYQNQVRKTQIMTIYKTLNEFRMPYRILLNKGGGMTGFNPNGLSMPLQTKYCQFSVMSPNTNSVTTDAIRCEIQNITYLTNQYISLDRTADGNWQCRASEGIAKNYLPQACQ